MTESFSARRVRVALALAAGLAVAAVWVGSRTTLAQAGCTPPTGNPILCENALAGNPPSEWGITGAGDLTIQGFSTDISVNRGQSIDFKIDTDATNYYLDIYRMGYYGGLGARKIATVVPSASLPQAQPACLTDAATGLVDCGNWSVSASWSVPADAVSGIYIAKAVRVDNGGASHIVFVVRNDASTSDLLFQTSDTTWQAYNEYGGNSFYTGSPAGRAYKVSYNRPLTTRATAPQDAVFNAEYPMVRWLESNGYDVTYFAGVDTDRHGSLIQQHKVFLSVGHDEYWSGAQRTNIEAARAAGVHLAFFSGNEVFWKTRWESSLSSPATAYRTLVSYKETHANAKIDPSAEWTGTWRDPRFSPPADGGRPENGLTGTLFRVNVGTTGITVPEEEGKLRFWRSTSIASLPPGQSVMLPNGTLGYEWDEDADNGFRPAGLVRLSNTTALGVDILQDHGSTFGTGNANHALTLYRHASGALVFGAGTIQWSWGLDSSHDRGSEPASLPMQQATVNLFADMGVQPLSLQGGLVSTSASTDVLPPTSGVTFPLHNTTVLANSNVTIQGLASDASGKVGGVEISLDGGLTWRRASGRSTWSYSWSTGSPRTISIFSRAADDSANLEQPVTGITVTIATPDGVAPTVTSVSPAQGSNGVSETTAVSAVFSESMSAGTITAATFELRDTTDAIVPAVVSYDNGTRTATLQPSSPLGFAKPYKVRVRSGAAGVKDATGTQLASDKVWSFVTTTPSGGGTPVLIVTSSGNSFSSYYAEILRAEGLNSFHTAAIGTLSPASLADYDLVLLGEMPLDSGQVSMFGDWVTAGGNLIAMRPDKQLATLLGLTDASSTLADGYLLVNTASAPGTGIVGQTMQFHGTADLYTGAGATTVATLYSNATTSTSYPAVALHSVGANGGQAAVFTYDLARSIVYTRQGNVAWAGQDRDGVPPIRSNDLFFGNGQPDYVDLTKVAIPQADEQQRLLINLMTLMNGDRKPLPRFWYFPRGEKAVVVMTGDDHALNGTAGRFNIYINNSPAGCSVEDWECVRASSYIFSSNPLLNAEAVSYASMGFELGVHVSTNCQNYTLSSLRQAFDSELALWHSELPGLALPTTNRTHCIPWSDYDSQAQVQTEFGIRLDTNYYYYPGSWVNNQPGMFTGSGMPMRFAKADGTMLDIYQAATQLTDESGQAYPLTIDTLLDRALGAEGYYGAFVANMHTDVVSHAGSQAIVNSAQARHVPIISSRQLLDWVDGRNETTLTNLGWASGTLTFSVASAAGARGLQALVPAEWQGQPLQTLMRTGSPVAYDIETLKGISYARFTSESGDYTAVYGEDTIPPVISEVAAAADFTRATITWTTDEGATSRVDYGTSPNVLTSSGSGGTGTSHAVTLMGLTPGLTYYYRVTSVDLSGNSATSPAPPAAAAVFKAVAACPCTIWPDTQTPLYGSANDNGPVELGVKFRPLVDGSITAIRFYKGPANTGVHVGTLWSAGGANLGSATFSGETGLGWQTASLPAPVPVTANTTYVVSYFAPSGGYAYDEMYFNSSGMTRGPLQAPSSPAAGGNGVFTYGASGFPSFSFGASNYWVDVVFMAQADTMPPSVTSTTPADQAGSISLDASVDVVFSEDMNSASISTSTVELRTSGNVLVPATVQYDHGTKTATLNPVSSLTYNSAYTIRVIGGASGVKDLGGNSMASTATATFTTLPAPPAAIGARTIGRYDLGSSTENESVSDPVTTQAVTNFAIFVSGQGGSTAPVVSDTYNNVWMQVGSGIQAGGVGQPTPGYLWVFVSLGASGGPGHVFTAAKPHAASSVLVTELVGHISLAASAIGSDSVSPYESPEITVAGAALLIGGMAAGFPEATATFTHGNGFTGLDTIGTSAYWTAANSYRGAGAGTHRTSVTLSLDGGVADPPYAEAVLAFVADIAPPHVSNVLPANGATNVPASTLVTATFDESIDPATVTGSTFTLQDSQSAIVPASVGYNPQTRTATLQPTQPLDYNASYTAHVVGGIAGVTDMAGNALVSDVTSSFTTVGPPDVTPPQVTAVSPVDGATGVPLLTVVTVTFSEDVNPATVTTATVELTNAASVLVPSTVLYDSETRTATIQPDNPLGPAELHGVRVVGGQAGVKDLAGNPLASHFIASFNTTYLAPTIGARVTGGYNTDGSSGDETVAGPIATGALTNFVIFVTGEGGAAPPVVTDSYNNTWTQFGSTMPVGGDGLGVPGYFWIFTARSALGGANHMFTASKLSGWTSMIVTEVVGNVVFEAGRIGTDATAPYAAPPVDVTEAALLISGSAFGFPDATPQLTDGNGFSTLEFMTTGEYWNLATASRTVTVGGTYQNSIDLTFEEGVPDGPYALALLAIRIRPGGGDETGPAISSVAPGNGAIDVPAASQVTVVFGERVSAVSVSEENVQLRDALDAVVPTRLSYDSSTRTVTLQPLFPLESSSVYTVHVKGGTTGVKDLSANPMDADLASGFTTGVATVPFVGARTTGAYDRGYSDQTSTYTFPMDTRAATNLVMFVTGENGDTPPLVADNYDNVWTQVGDAIPAGGGGQETTGYLWVFVSMGAAGGPGHEFAVDKFAGFTSVLVEEIVGDVMLDDAVLSADGVAPYESAGLTVDGPALLVGAFAFGFPDTYGTPVHGNGFLPLNIVSSGANWALAGMSRTVEAGVYNSSDDVVVGPGGEVDPPAATALLAFRLNN